MRGVCPSTYEPIQPLDTSAATSPALNYPGSTSSLGSSTSPPRRLDGLSPKRSSSPNKAKKYSSRGYVFIEKFLRKSNMIYYDEFGLLCSGNWYIYIDIFIFIESFNV